MMKLNPDERYQTPAQLLEVIRELRHELNAKSDGDMPVKKTGPHTLFLVEKNDALQNLLREKLKEKGFKVLIAGDPQRAVDRFHQNPFDIFVVNAATTGQDGILAFEKVMRDAQRQNRATGGVLLLLSEQAKSTKPLNELKAVRSASRSVLGTIAKIREFWRRSSASPDAPLRFAFAGSEWGRRPGSAGRPRETTGPPIRHHRRDRCSTSFHDSAEITAAPPPPARRRSVRRAHWSPAPRRDRRRAIPASRRRD